MQRLVRSGALNRTFFLLMGDHGFQRAESPFFQSKQGFAEQDHPAFYLLPPVETDDASSPGSSSSLARKGARW